MQIVSVHSLRITALRRTLMSHARSVKPFLRCSLFMAVSAFVLLQYYEVYLVTMSFLCSPFRSCYREFVSLSVSPFLLSSLFHPNLPALGSSAYLLSPVSFASESDGPLIQGGISAASDKRMSVLNKLIGAVKLIKFFAWEERWISRVLGARETELQWFIKSGCRLQCFSSLSRLTGL